MQIFYKPEINSVRLNLPDAEVKQGIDFLEFILEKVHPKYTYADFLRQDAINDEFCFIFESEYMEIALRLLGYYAYALKKKECSLLVNQISEVIQKIQPGYKAPWIL